MVSVVVCTYNRASSLRRTLESLGQMSVPPDLPWELIVVDNNSSDDTKEVVETFSRASSLNIRYFFERDQGLSYARNTGVREAKGEIIAFTDDDLTVDKGWLVNIKKAFDEFDCLGMGGKTDLVWAGEKPCWFDETAGAGPYCLGTVLAALDLGARPRVMTTITPPGCNMAFLKTAFERHGLFRTDLGTCGGSVGGGEEDEEFCLRLMRHGDKVIYAPDVVAHHHIPEHRAKKEYFQSWYFNVGRRIARMKPPPEAVVRYFGVPRHLLRSLGEMLLMWMFTPRGMKRFAYKLQAYWIAGQVVEMNRLSTRTTRLNS